MVFYLSERFIDNTRHLYISENRVIKILIYFIYGIFTIYCCFFDLQLGYLFKTRCFPSLPHDRFDF
jgi:hypothetical protein